MEFKLVYGNHNDDAVHMYDTLMLVKHGLASAGHKVDLSRYMVPGKINIIIEYFSYDFIEAAKSVAASSGTEFILIATEFITGDTFNLFEPVSGEDQFICEHYNNLGSWKKRYLTFIKMYEMSRAVWHLSENQVSPYREKLRNDNIFYLPHGYLEGLSAVEVRPWHYRDIDIIFTGTLTPYRKSILDELALTGITIDSIPVSTPPYIRDDMVARSKLAINIKQNKNWKYPSNSRFYYHLVNASPLLSELTEYECDLSHYIMHADSINFLESCMELLERGEGLIDEYRERQREFRHDLPMKELAEALIDRTFGSQL